MNKQLTIPMHSPKLSCEQNWCGLYIAVFCAHVNVYKTVYPFLFIF